MALPVASAMSRPPLSVVIPARLEAERLPLLLADLQQGPAGLVRETFVVDSSPEPDTAAVARLAGAQVLRSEANRGRQLQVGIAAATAPWLLLLHADSRLPTDWGTRMERAMAQAPAAWYFDFQVAAAGLKLRLLEWAVHWRCQLRALPYGDQGLLLPRALLERAGGMRPLPLMEDLDLIQRLQPLAPIRRLGLPLAVHGRRWKRDGVLRTAQRNASLRRAWRQGATEDDLAQRYYR